MEKRMRLLVRLKALVIILNFNAFPCQSQVNAHHELTVEQMHEDLDSLLHVIIQSHPKPGGFATQQVLESAFKEAALQTDSTQTILQFAETIAELMHTMHDSHSGVDYGQLQQMCFEGNGYLLPLSCFVHEEKIYVHHDWEDKIPRGSRLLAINEVKIEWLMEKALKFACVEGEAIEAQTTVALALIPVIASLYAPAKLQNQIEIVNIETGKTELIMLQGLNKRKFERERRKRGMLPENKILNLSWSEHRTSATLKVETFAPAGKGYYQRYIKRAFKQIAAEKCDTLVIDLRGNGGGSSSWVEYLYAFIDTAGYNTPSNVIAKNSELALKRAKLLNKRFSRMILRFFFRKNEDVSSFLRITDLPLGQIDTTYFTVKTKHKKEWVFTGKCFLLINGLTASAGVDFTNAFTTRKRGIVLGTSCLGPHTGTWGNPAVYTLPQSKLRVSISTIRYNYDNSFTYSSSPIEPDVVIRPTPKGVHEKRDEVREAVSKK